MKKFKIFFYPAYLIIALVILYFSIDILINMNSYREKIDIDTQLNLPTYLLYLFLLLSLLMLTELAVENIQIIKLKKKVRHAEEEALRLKAKLYDQGEDATGHGASGFLKESSLDHGIEEHHADKGESDSADEYELN